MQITLDIERMESDRSNFTMMHLDKAIGLELTSNNLKTIRMIF